MSIATPPFKAIPTTYNGIQLKSRMEAQCALLFDTLGWEWQYEPESLMLPSGVNYLPDFWIPEFQCVIECRGYESDKGRKQIEGFRDLIRDSGTGSHRFGSSPSYLTIGPERVEFFWCVGATILTEGVIAWCDRCRMWAPSGEWIQICHCSCCQSHLTQRITVDEGKISVGNFTSENWNSSFIVNRDYCHELAIRETMRESFRMSRLIMEMSGLLVAEQK